MNPVYTVTFIKKNLNENYQKKIRGKYLILNFCDTVVSPIFVYYLRICC